MRVTQTRRAWLLIAPFVVVAAGCKAPQAPRAVPFRVDRHGAANALEQDRTGLRWVLPFPAAREKARAEKRLLMIKPVAFGTSRTGDW